MNEDFFKFVLEEFKLNLEDIHGINHWLRVYYNGIILANENGANKKIIFYFAFLHDLKRNADWQDRIEHGPRVAKFLDEIKDKYLNELNKEEFEILKEACKIHSITEQNISDITIKTCLDADRLDLARVNIIPNPKYLFTDIAKRKDIIDEAVKRSKENFKPNFFEKEFGLINLENFLNN